MSDDGKMLVGVAYFKDREPVDNYSDANTATVSVLGDSELNGQLFTLTILDNSIKPSWMPAVNDSEILEITEEVLTKLLDGDEGEDTDTES